MTKEAKTEIEDRVSLSVTFVSVSTKSIVVEACSTPTLPKTTATVLIVSKVPVYLSIGFTNISLADNNNNNNNGMNILHFFSCFKLYQFDKINKSK